MLKNCEKINVILKRVLRIYQLNKKVEENKCILLWDDVVGREISQHTCAVKVKFDKLYVLVDTPVWAETISLLKSTILKKLNQNIDKDVCIKDINLKIGNFYKFKKTRDNEGNKI